MRHEAAFGTNLGKIRENLSKFAEINWIREFAEMATKRNNTYLLRSARRRRRRQRRALTRDILGILFAAVACWGMYYWLNHWKGDSHEVELSAPGGLKLSGSLEEVKMPDGVPQQIVAYPGFTVNFNAEHHVPNYVVWELTADECKGSEPRLKNFFEDKNVEGCPTLYDYRKSGYTRGHMAPAADMKWSAEAMRASNYLTNICPQAASMNSGAWSTLEENCRAWAMRDSAIVIIAGPVLTDRMPLHIGKNRVAVPERFFKVVLAPYVNPPRGIGFVMPNSKVRGGVHTHAMSIDEVEEITGMDFFSALPDDIETAVEKENSYPKWQTLK